MHVCFDVVHTVSPAPAGGSRPGSGSTTRLDVSPAPSGMILDTETVSGGSGGEPRMRGDDSRKREGEKYEEHDEKDER